MKFNIRSFDYCLEIPEKYINVIKKYAKDCKVELVKDDNDDEIAINLIKLISSSPLGK